MHLFIGYLLSLTGAEEEEEEEDQLDDAEGAAVFASPLK